MYCLSKVDDKFLKPGVKPMANQRSLYPGCPYAGGCHCMAHDKAVGFDIARISEIRTAIIMSPIGAVPVADGDLTLMTSHGLSPLAMADSHWVSDGGFNLTLVDLTGATFDSGPSGFIEVGSLTALLASLDNQPTLPGLPAPPITAVTTPPMDLVTLLDVNMHPPANATDDHEDFDDGSADLFAGGTSARRASDVYHGRTRVDEYIA
jgi:hypothetical protein